MHRNWLNHILDKSMSWYTEARCIISNGCSWPQIAMGWKRSWRWRPVTEKAVYNWVLGKAAAGGDWLHWAEWVGTGAIADSQVRPWLSWCQLTSRGKGGSPLTEFWVMAQIWGLVFATSGICLQWHTGLRCYSSYWPSAWNGHLCSWPLAIFRPTRVPISPQCNSPALNMLIYNALFCSFGRIQKELLGRNLSLAGVGWGW